MVKKILEHIFNRFLYREIQTLSSAAMLLGFFTLLSQILAFVRDRLLAHIFGAGSDLDIYYAAFRIPDFIFVAAASIVSLSVLIPFILEKDAQGREELREFIDNVFSFFSVIIIAVSVLAFFLIPWVSGLLFKGFSPGEFSQVVFLSRLLLLSPIILGFSNLLGSLTQAYHRFALYALAPILYNTGIVVGIIIFARELGALGVVIGVLLGAILHALVQVPYVWKAGLMPRIRPKFDISAISKVVKISFPRTLTLSMSSITFLFLIALASLMPSGSISILNLSFNLSSVPLGLIGVSYSLAAFPTLTRKFQEKRIDAFISEMAATARLIIFWSMPLTVLLIVLRAQIVRVLLGTGEFGWDATRLTAAALALFVLSALFQSLLLLFMRGFYSAGITHKPFYINLVSTIVLIASTYGLVKFFYQSSTFHYFIAALMKVEDLPNAAVLMLPLGFSLGTILNGALLWISFEREFRGFSRAVMRTLFESVSASIMMGTAAYVGLQIFSKIFSSSTILGVFIQGFLAGLAAIAVGVVILLAFKSKELQSIWEVIHSKFWKSSVIATDPKIV